MDEVLSPRVLEIYREADAAVADAGPVCVASGRCCRFKEYGHVLFLSNLEAEVLLDAVPPHTRPVSADFCPFQESLVYGPRAAALRLPGLLLRSRVSGNRQRDHGNVSAPAQGIGPGVALAMAVRPAASVLESSFASFRPAGRNHQGVTYV